MVTPLSGASACLCLFAGAAALYGAESLPGPSGAAWRVKQIIGHRGASHLCPENTLASLRRAIEAGATAVEVDVRRSRDGQLVLRHDDALERTTNGRGLVREQTLAELKQLDAGAWFAPQFAGERIPTLDEALALCRGRIDVMLDLKEQGEDYDRQIAAAVREFGEEPRAILGVRSVEQARRLRTLLPQARQIGLIATADEIEAYAAAGAEIIRLWPRWLTDGSLVDRVRKAGAGLHLGAAAGTEDEVLPLLAHRPDSLSADDPARLLATLAQLAAQAIGPAPLPMAGELALPGLQAPVTITRDAAGMAHIEAQNADDLFFAQGFVVAQDRLFQIDLWRRQAVGELAEALGPAAVPADVFARRIRYRGDLQAEWESYAPDARAIATAFTRGINAGIDQFGDRLPIEFRLLGFRPKKWAPEDVLGRSSGIYMTQNFRNELLRLQLIKLVGEERARWLAPVDPPHAWSLRLPPEEVEHFPDDLLREYEALTKSLSFTPPKTESNNWVLAGARSQSGKPLLASDPHREIALPSLRYLVHLKAPGWNVIGAGEPGLPGVAIGHNDRIAWGITIIGADTADLFVEELNPDNLDEVAVGERFEPLRQWQEDISVRGQTEPVRITVKHSRHGPILYEDRARRRAYALAWTGNEPGGAAYLASLRVGRAQNWQEFRDALAHWRVPGLNFVYADTAGHTGWVAAANYPLRQGGHVGLLPVPGKGGYDWTGYRPPAEWPHVYQPPSGAVVTANHNIIPPNYRETVGFEFAPPYRFERLHSLLSAKPKWELGEFRGLQQDHVSLPARQLAQVLQEVGAAPADQPAAALLANWDGALSVDSPAGSLYALWQKELQEALFLRHVPPQQVRLLNSLAGVEATIAALTKLDPRWLGKDAAAERTRLVRESFARAVEKWKQLPTEQQQRWGALHTVTFRHPLATLGPVAEKLLNVGPFERPGEGNTPNNTRYDDRFQQIHGATFRQLLDLADWDRGLATSAPGQSGWPGSPHYGDLAAAWSRGEYFSLPFSPAKVGEAARHQLRLTPAK